MAWFCCIDKSYKIFFLKYVSWMNIVGFVAIIIRFARNSLHRDKQIGPRCKNNWIVVASITDLWRIYARWSRSVRVNGIRCMQEEDRSPVHTLSRKLQDKLFSRNNEWLDVKTNVGRSIIRAPLKTRRWPQVNMHRWFKLTFYQVNRTSSNRWIFKFSIAWGKLNANFDRDPIKRVNKFWTGFKRNRSVDRYRS